MPFCECVLNERTRLIVFCAVLLMWFLTAIGTVGLWRLSMSNEEKRNVLRREWSDLSIAYNIMAFKLGNERLDELQPIKGDVSSLRNGIAVKVEKFHNMVKECKKNGKIKPKTLVSEDEKWEDFMNDVLMGESDETVDDEQLIMAKIVRLMLIEEGSASCGFDCEP